MAVGCGGRSSTAGGGGSWRPVLDGGNCDWVVAAGFAGAAAAAAPDPAPDLACFFLRAFVFAGLCLEQQAPLLRRCSLRSCIICICAFHDCPLLLVLLTRPRWSSAQPFCFFFRCFVARSCLSVSSVAFVLLPFCFFRCFVLRVVLVLLGSLLVAAFFVLALPRVVT